MSRPAPARKAASNAIAASVALAVDAPGEAEGCEEEEAMAVAEAMAQVVMDVVVAEAVAPARNLVFEHVCAVTMVAKAEFHARCALRFALQLQAIADTSGQHLTLCGSLLARDLRSDCKTSPYALRKQAEHI